LHNGISTRESAIVRQARNKRKRENFFSRNNFSGLCAADRALMPMDRYQTNKIEMNGKSKINSVRYLMRKTPRKKEESMAKKKEKSRSDCSE
jgi:hypothetical protein